ncbi:MAG: TetR/AcrR family transcriptional regulator [Anaerolineae bacterium]
MDRRQRLIEAGLAVFAEMGYHRAKVSDIVRQAGVAQGTFYLYFASKKDLFLTLLNEFCALIEQALIEADFNAEHAQTAADVARQIRDAIGRILAVYRGNATLARLFLRESISLEPDFAHAWETFIDRVATMGAAYLDQAIERGLLLSQNSQVVAFCLVGMIERVAHHWLAGDVSADLDTLADTVTRFELLGIMGGPSPEVAAVLAGEEVWP